MDANVGSIGVTIAATWDEISTYFLLNHILCSSKNHGTYLELKKGGIFFLVF